LKTSKPLTGCPAKQQWSAKENFKKALAN